MRRTLTAAAIAIAFLALRPEAAFAHAAFVSSQPAPGATVSATPGVVVLTYTEPLNRRLSGARVTDPSGRAFEGTPSGDREIRILLSTNTPGVYAVSWTTVSTVDGHTLRGSFRFGVGVEPGAGSEGTVAIAPGATDLLIAIARAVEYLGLLSAIGAMLLGRLARRDPRLHWVKARLRLSLGVALVGGVAVVLGEGLVASGASVGGLWSYLSTGLPGAARLLRVAFEASALAASRLRARGVALLVASSLAALAAAGHAAASRPSWLGILIDGLHLASAGLWAGGILQLAPMRPPGGWRRGEGRPLLDRFTPVALPAFVATVGFGTVRAFQELGGIGDLVGSSYGRILTAKIAGVVAMVPLSLLAWRRLARSPRAEAGVAVGVIALAATLAAYPLPPGRAGESEAAAPDVSRPGLPRAGDLTMGEAAGIVVVGLTIRPGTPGPNDVYVFLEAPEGLPVEKTLRVETRADGEPVVLESCGPPCRRFDATFEGGERIEVRVVHPKGGSATFEVPALPAQDATELVERARARMHRLGTLRAEETLRGAPEIINAYAFQSPDRYRIAQRGSFESIAIGGKRYSRERSGAPWKTSSGEPGKVPFFVFDGFSPVAPRVIGEASIGNVATRIVSFATSDEESPIWFKLWMDAEGLVVRGEMRARNHVMSLRYFDFNAAFTIDPPL
ncbi:MAG: copper resistance protein CopC [Anaerolineales bacterium]